MNKYTKLVESFRAADEAGNQYQVDCHQEFIEAEDIAGGLTVFDGLKSYFIDGKQVNCVGEGVFQILGSNTKVTKV